MQQYDPKPVTVVDNLITDDSDKALSAKQGKTLSDQVGTLGTRVNGKVTKYTYASNSSNKFVISDFTDSYDDLFVFGVGAYNWVYCAVWHLAPSAVSISAFVNTNTVISSVTRAADGTITASATSPYGTLCIISRVR